VTDEPLAYRVEWAGPAQRSLRRIPDKVAVAVIEFVYGPLADNPFRVGRRLRWELEGLHAARRGDYRIVYRIDDARHVVTIEAIAHRADVYRRTAN
jgi:mRNA-degrading endonuclease RelE of RelBE toxin-antitoxin system